VTVERKFTTYGSQLELECATKKEVVRCPIGRSEKEFEAILTTNVEMLQRYIQENC
jgi:hypothetical protein